MPCNNIPTEDSHTSEILSLRGYVAIVTGGNKTLFSIRAWERFYTYGFKTAYPGKWAIPKTS